MKNYVICTDSSCDFSQEEIIKRGLLCPSLTFHFDGEHKEYLSGEMDTSEFYSRMRMGQIAKTAAVNSRVFSIFFCDILKNGQDILYLGLSSALSSTVSAAKLAAKELMTKFPERRIIVIDSLCASAGIALLYDFVASKKQSGATLEEAAEYAEQIKSKICHWFTVEDLSYLRRGGRIGTTSAFVGNILAIKPVMHVDESGRLTNYKNVRGRRQSIEALAQKFADGRDGIADNTVYISHGDCPEDASKLASILIEKHGAKVKLVTSVGPVIGAHSGPGTLAVFFVGKAR